MQGKLVSFFKRHSIKSDEKLYFIQHLALMIRAGVSLPRAIEILTEQSKNKYWRDILGDIRENLVQGNSFEKSLSRHKEVFGAALISMVRIGEMKGDLVMVLEKFFELARKEEELKRKLKSAMAYPIVVASAMVLLGIAVVFYIFPKIAEIFKEADLKLPLPTRILIGISDIVVGYGALILVLTVALVIAFIFWKKTKRGKSLWTALLLRLPIVSGIMKEKNLAHLTRNLGILLKAGVPISEAFLATANGLENVFYKQSLLEARDEVNKGNFVHTAFLKYADIYPNLIIQIIIVGEEAGVLDEVLFEISSFYETRVTNTFDSMSAIIEPVLILILGLGVAFMALSILMPIYSIAQT
jgi:type II secretory pathway component PulF